jgi:predicted phosphoribosyltransferase
MVKFKNLDDACTRLKEYLPRIENKENAIILGISDNKGFFSPYLAHKIHQYLKIEFDFLFVKRVSSPVNKNLTVAMISESGHISTNDELIDYLDIKKSYIYNESAREYEGITGHSHVFKENDLEEKIQGRDIYLVDYAIGSGLKIVCAIDSVIDKGAKSVHVISPIVPALLFDDLYSKVDNIYYVYKVKHFVSKKFYYTHLDEHKIDIETIAHLEDNKIKGKTIE